MSDERASCLACGGAGGGPFGRAGSAWDTEDYVCPRCRGTGAERLDVTVSASASASPALARPGVAKVPNVPVRRKRAAGDES
jgi:hypothetical protein